MTIFSNRSQLSFAAIVDFSSMGATAIAYFFAFHNPTTVVNPLLLWRDGSNEIANQPAYRDIRAAVREGRAPSFTAWRFLGAAI